MKMMEVGRNGVLLEIVPIQEAIAKEHDIEIVIHPGHLKEAYPVLDPIQSQKIVTRRYALVGTLDTLRAITYYSYIFKLNTVWNSTNVIFLF